MLCNNDFLYIHVPKTGGMWLTALLISIVKGTLYSFVPPGHDPPHKNVVTIPGKRHEFLDEAIPLLESVGIAFNRLKWIAASMRNPYDLEVSRYFYLRQGHPWDQGPDQHMALTTSFSAFARHSTFHGRTLENTQIERYYTLNGSMPYNLVILRKESLKTDVKKFLLKMGLTPEFCLPRINMSSHHHYKQYLSADSEEAIYHRYCWIFDSGFYPREKF